MNNGLVNIEFCKSEIIFHLKSKNVSYIMNVDKYGYLNHVYWGKKVEKYSTSIPKSYKERPFSPNPIPEDRNYSLDTIALEYPTYGNTDFRTPAVQIEFMDGSRITNLKYHSHRILEGKSVIEGLPATYVEDSTEADSLEITLKDSDSNVFITLLYSAFSDYDAITRSVNITNKEQKSIKLNRVYSCNVDFSNNDYELLNLSGSWARERHINKKTLKPGRYVTESRRGSSSHYQNPFIAISSKGAGEKHGEIYGFSLVYSGNFIADVEVDQFFSTRVGMGINPFEFSWTLEAGLSFQTPEVVMIYSDTGYGKMSRMYHDLYRNRLCRGKHRDNIRPVLINNWEATYFDFTEEKIVQIAKEAKDLGIELLVLDDGWFGKRDDDQSSLGDWFPDMRKLPGGLSQLIEKVDSFGLKFGIWVEPEMISRDSELFRKHSDWYIGTKGRTSSEGRNQLVLDLTQKEVCDYIVNILSDLFEANQISYVKWDMNRNMTEVGSLKLEKDKQQEVFHRYILGLYYILNILTEKFPDILFESCSGGGGRFDPGMLYYMPQTWTSDDTDAYERQKIQYGTSIVYPLITMGSHVSDIPNHQVYRNTPLETRANVAFAGNLGYELDIVNLSDGEKKKISEQISFYKSIREVIQFGDFYRLLSPFESNDTSWMVVSKDKSQACVFYYQNLNIPNGPFKHIKLSGLEHGALYEIENHNIEIYGDELMNIGLELPEFKGDFSSIVYTLRKRK